MSEATSLNGNQQPRPVLPLYLFVSPLYLFTGTPSRPRRYHFRFHLNSLATAMAGRYQRRTQETHEKGRSSVRVLSPLLGRRTPYLIHGEAFGTRAATIAVIAVLLRCY